MEEKELNPLEELDNPVDNLEVEKEPKTPVAKEQKDNSIKKDDQVEKSDTEPEKESEKPQTTAKERRHAQQVEGARKEVERLRNMVIDEEVNKASKDAKSLLELANKDPKLADEVARKFGYANFKEAKSQINAGEGTETKSGGNEQEKFEQWYQERRAKEEHESSLQEAEKIIDKLPEDLQEEAKAYFDEITEGKTLNRDKALTYAKMATLYVSDGKEPVKEEKKEKVDKSEGLRKLSSTGISQSKKVEKAEPEMVIFGGEEIFLNSNNKN